MPAIASILQHILTLNGVITALSALVVLFIFRYRSHAIGTRRREDLKQPKNVVPLLGHLPLFTSVPASQIYHFYERQSNELGPLWSISLPFFGRIVQTDIPGNIEHVLRTNFWGYVKGPMFKDILADLVGEGGIVTADGAHWKFQRKLASHIFTIQAFREYTSKVFVVHGKKVIEILGKAADQGSVVEFQSLMLSFTLDCLGEIAFGKDFGCLEDIDNPPPFAASFDYLLANCSRRILNPMWKFTDRWNGVSQEVEYHRNLIRGYALDIIDKRKKEADSSRKVDLLQLFMDGHDEKGLPLSEDLVIDNILTFMVAGRETTACSLTWMLYLLYRDDTDRHVAETLVQEVDDVLKGLDPSYETYKKQKYAEACFNEAVRLYPLIPLDLRYCMEDDVLPDGTKIYAGEWVGWSPYVMARSEHIWGSDAKEYKPSRWLNREKPPQSKFTAFGVGPRVCIGQQFATIEGLTIIGMILQSFDVKLVDPSKVRGYAVSITLPMQDGLEIQVSRRKQQ